MTTENVSTLLDLLMPHFQYDVEKARRSSFGTVASDLQLALTLRILAGASYLGVMMLFGISRAAVYAVLHGTVDDILTQLKLPGIPLETPAYLMELPHHFTVSCLHVHPLLAVWVHSM